MQVMLSCNGKLLIKQSSCIKDYLFGIESYPVLVPSEEGPSEDVIDDVSTPLADTFQQSEEIDLTPYAACRRGVSSDDLLVVPLALATLELLWPLRPTTSLFVTAFSEFA